MYEIKARAKINLSLKITGKRGALHTLNSAVVPVDLCDDVKMERRRDGRVTLRYDGKDGIYPNDTALKTAELIVAKYGLGGVDISIKKRIPEGAGMGGSSADAAAVARGMEKLFGYGDTDSDILLSVGSDVMCMYYGGSCVVGGTGETVSPLNILKKIYFAAVLSDERVNTADCYALFDKIGGEKEDADVVGALEKGEYFTPENDLMKAAVKLCPSIETRISLLTEAGFSAGMTGSGSAVFGYEYDLDRFEEKLRILKEIAEDKFRIITF